MTEQQPESPGASAERDAGTAQSPSLRAFVTATGLVFQAVGMIMLFGSCCFWSFSGHVVEPSDVPAAQWTDYLRGERLPAALLTICVVVTFVGGIALTAAGVGLQGEKLRSGRFAMAVAAPMALIYGTAGVILVTRTDLWVRGLMPILFAAVSILLFMLAGHSSSLLRQFPPPADQHVATEEFLRQHKEERLKRLQEYDP